MSDLRARLNALDRDASPGPPRELPQYAKDAPQRTVYLKAGRVTNIYGLGGYFAQSDARLSLTLLSERGGIQVISTDAFFIDGDGNELVLVDAQLAAAGRQVPMLGRALLGVQEQEDHRVECNDCWKDGPQDCKEYQHLRMEAFGQRTTALAELAKALERS